MSFARKVLQRYPFLKPIDARMANDVDMNALRREIWQKRIEYWVRKSEQWPHTKANAKIEFKETIELLKNPGQLSYKQLVTGLVWGVQIFGVFCIGECIGRGSFFGYKVGDWHGNKAAH